MTYDTCSYSSTCTAVTCTANYWNDDSDTMNGCEAGYPECRRDLVYLQRFVVMHTFDCNANYFYDDVYASNGFEACCPTVTDETCDICAIHRHAQLLLATPTVSMMVLMPRMGVKQAAPQLWI